jgi:1,4-alpha-glucan branching enzyme
VDPYSFGPLLQDADLVAFSAGHEAHAGRWLGAHCTELDGMAGYWFAVWAPNAQRVSVVGDFNQWDGRCHPMRSRGSSGVWELFIPGMAANVLYKYEVCNRLTGQLHLKADPYGSRHEARPKTASITVPPSTHRWRDGQWIDRRSSWQWLTAPVSIYEMHLGSWRRNDSGETMSYGELAAPLADYLTRMGFTHVEFLPLMEYPLDDSWGYQPTGYYAPTTRYGSPDELRVLVDELHRHDIGVLLDWVPGHFPKDEHGLARFDGSTLYEYSDPLKGEHPDWGTLVFDYDRNEVRSFLTSSALHWLEDYHFDGLRVDAVASMLYLDYSREAGQWTPNARGGNENLEAVAFLRQLNTITHRDCLGSITVAEESTAWPGVSRPSDSGGLGFSMKWNMGWMHDTLKYMSREPVHRQHYHDLLSFGPTYAFSENFVLPLSHDEVVHGKGSLLGKMPGDRWQQLANLRLLFTFQWTYPGKKLLFMGGELAQPTEWDYRGVLPWELLKNPEHGGIQRIVADLNTLYRTRSELHYYDFQAEGFRWLRWDDAPNSVLSYLRSDGNQFAVVLLNFTPVPRHDYRVGFPHDGSWREIFNSDSRFYGGGDLGNPVPIDAQAVPWMDQPYSALVTLPPLAGVILTPGG